MTTLRGFRRKYENAVRLLDVKKRVAKLDALGSEISAIAWQPSVDGEVRELLFLCLRRIRDANTNWKASNWIERI